MNCGVGTLESPLDCKEIQPVYPKGDQLKLKLQYFAHLMQRAESFEKTLMLGKIEGGRKMGQHRMRWLDGITHHSVNMSLLAWFYCRYGGFWMRSCLFMFPGIRSCLIFPSLGIRPPASDFQSYSYSSLKTSPFIQYGR